MRSVKSRNDAVPNQHSRCSTRRGGGGRPTEQADRLPPGRPCRKTKLVTVQSGACSTAGQCPERRHRGPCHRAWPGQCLRWQRCEHPRPTPRAGRKDAIQIRGLPARARPVELTRSSCNVSRNSASPRSSSCRNSPHDPTASTGVLAMSTLPLRMRPDLRAKSWIGVVGGLSPRRDGPLCAGAPRCQRRSCSLRCACSTLTPQRAGTGGLDRARAIHTVGSCRHRAHLVCPVLGVHRVGS